VKASKFNSALRKVDRCTGTDKTVKTGARKGGCKVQIGHGNTKRKRLGVGSLLGKRGWGRVEQRDPTTSPYEISGKGAEMEKKEIR